MSTTVEAPEPRNIAAEGRETLQSQIALAPQQFAAESQYAPQYAQLYQDVLNQSLFGQGGQGGLLQTYQQAAPQLGQIQAQANTQQRLADIADVEQYGQRAVQAFNQANPELASIRAQIAQSAQSGGGATAISAPTAMAALLGEAPTINPSLLGQAPSGIASLLGNAPTINASLLGNAPSATASTNTFTASPYERLTAGPNASADAYNQRALSDLALGGSLGRGETRDLTNEVLSRFNRAGRVNDPAAIAATALELDQAQQARLAQRQSAVAQGAGMTQAQNALGLQAGIANQGAGLQQQGYGLQADLANQQARQQAALANLGVGAQYGLANQASQQQAALANQSLQGQYGLSNQSAQQQMALANLGLQGQYGLSNQQSSQQAALANQAMRGQYGMANQAAQQQTNLANMDTAYRTALANQQAEIANEQLRQQRLMQAAGFLQSSQIDPFQAILGRSGSLQGAMGATQQGGAGAGYTGTGMFNPFTQYSSQLYGQNYSTAYDANLQSAANKNNLWGAGIGAIGTLGGAFFGR